MSADSFLTIQAAARAEIKVKCSRFIGESFRVTTVDDALSQLATVRKREYQANHHCYAYTVRTEGDHQFRYADDGEPSGTAGRPIYDIITGRKVTNLLLVVTRYFGGTKLGTGGLVRAYGDTAKATLEASGVLEILITSSFRCRIDFSLYDQWLREIHKLEAKVDDAQFSDRVVLTVSIRKSRVESLLGAFRELTSGKGEVEEIDQA
jgi:uncharacterized YigZ family protein